MRQLKITKSITNRETASLEKYFRDIGKEELITADEEVRLAQRIHQGDQKALNKLCLANLRFVVSVAKQYQNQGLALPDLINEGNVGLVKAAQRFDETRGFKFISYAVWWIRQSILQGLAEQSRIVRLPLNQVGSLNKIKKEESRLEQRFGRLPTHEELSESLEISEDKIEFSLSNNYLFISMDSPLIGDENTTFGENFIDDNAPSTDSFLIHESLALEIQRALETLKPREKEVICLYYGIGVTHSLTLEEIGDRFDYTRERIRQIKEKAIRRLKHTTRSKILKTYLGQ